MQVCFTKHDQLVIADLSFIYQCPLQYQINNIETENVSGLREGEIEWRLKQSSNIFIHKQNFGRFKDVNFIQV